MNESLAESVSRFLWSSLHPQKKPANFYFLCLAGAQCVPQISNTGGIPTVLIPFLLLLGVEAIFAHMEDVRKRKSDTEANHYMSSRYDYYLRRFVDVKWEDIQVGDLLQVKCRAIIPADMVLFAVAEKHDPPKGICHVETKSLDGETHLKARHALSITMNSMQDIATIDALQGEVVMEHPNRRINEFQGRIDLGNKFGRQAIESNNVLLRGTILRSTDWAIGLVVNTGKDTKIMMSRNDNRVKKSGVQQMMDVQTKRVIGLLFLASVCGAVGAVAFAGNVQYGVGTAWYLRGLLQNGSSNLSFYFFTSLGYFFVLYGSLVPVSLYMSLFFARFFQAFFMRLDLEMYLDRKDCPMEVRNIMLNEELGQISHVFTDKTGTLTRNVLDFRKASINGEVYGSGITEIGRHVYRLQGFEVPPDIEEEDAKASSNAVPHVVFHCHKYEREMQNSSSLQRAKIQEFFRTLAICHEVTYERVEGLSSLSAPNPDDECLVCAAEYFGFRFCDRRDAFLVLENRDRRNGIEEVEVLETIQFTHERKRMSVVVREADGSIRLYCKGADVAILSRISSSDRRGQEETLQHMRDFSVQGLRSLLVCFSADRIPEKKFLDWQTHYHECKVDATQLELRRNGHSNLIDELEDLLEQDLRLLGVAGIDDKLQMGVPNCVHELTTAGIHVWMLTGDKDETALAIALACNMVLPKAYMHRIHLNLHHHHSLGHGQHPVDEHDRDDNQESASLFIKDVLTREIAAFDREVQEVGAVSCKPRALLFDGAALGHLLSDHDEELNRLFLAIIQRCKALVMSRASPADKSDLVRFVRLFVPGSRTLAVGDGANDVSMVQEAHVGVGIMGDEGLEAVNVSDYAIAQFRFLSPLLLKHGYRNYVRTANLVNFSFYKNFLLSSSLFWFNFNTAYSGQKLSTEGALQLYSVFFTSMQILAYTAYDSSPCSETMYRYPQLYRSSLANEAFNNWTFWGRWVAHGLLESLALSIAPLYLVSDLTSFLEAGVVCLCGCVIVANLKIFVILQSRLHWWNLVLLFLQLGTLAGTFFIISNFTWLDFEFYKLFEHLQVNPTTWLTLLLLLVAIIGKDLYLVSIDRCFNYKPLHLAQELDAGLSPLKGSSVASAEKIRDEPWGPSDDSVSTKSYGGRLGGTSPATVRPAPSSPSPSPSMRGPASIRRRIELSVERDEEKGDTITRPAESVANTPL
jgi:phospholipid-translocating P-type ATPase (flippase)